MNAGVAWAMVAAVGFAFLQASNRKSNQLIGAYRTALGLLSIVLVILWVRSLFLGDLVRLLDVPIQAVGLFAVAATLHFVGGWTLLALSQQRIGVARTGALVSSAPLIGTLLAALFLGETLTLTVLTGVVMAVVGVALISLSSPKATGPAWRQPWLALTVALMWGASPILLRRGLEYVPDPMSGLTLGLSLTVPVYALALGLAGKWRERRVPSTAVRWLMIGGACGAVAVSAQWISYGLTTVAIAITVQQMSALGVIALVPFMFKEPFERMNLTFFLGVAAMLGGSVMVVLTG